MEPARQQERHRQRSEVAERLAERLRTSADIGECLAAISALERLDAPEATPALCEAVTPERPPQVRQRALQALSKRQDPVSLPVLCELVSDADPSVSLLALGAVASFGDRSAISALCGALHDVRTTPIGLSYRVVAAQVLMLIARRTPGPELGEALEPLRMLARIWGRDQHVFEEALATVERALSMDLPLPSAAPGPGEETLPRPANPPPEDPDRLPTPAAKPGSSEPE